MTAAEHLARLRAKAAAGTALLAAGVSTGLVARSAERGGADLLVVYNSGLYRSHGLSSLSGLMPYGDANAIVVEMGRQVLPAVSSVPVLAGVCATDPFRSIPAFLRQLQDMGFAGVQNFPSVALIDGRFREDLEATGICFEREVEMMAVARELGLLTCAFVCTAAESAAMAQAGSHVVAPHLGVTRAGGRLEDAADQVQEMRDAAVAVAPDVLVLFHGGPASGPDEVSQVLAATEGVAGFFAASGVERQPVERAVEQAARAFASLSVTPTETAAPEPEQELTRTTLPAYLRSRGVVGADEPVEVEDLGGGISNALMMFCTATDRGVVKQARSRVRVAQEWLCDVRRIFAERDAITVVAPLLQEGSAPRIRFSDDVNYAFVMEAAPATSHLWKDDLLAGRVSLPLAREAGAMLAAIHVGTAGDESLRRRFGTAMLSQLRIDPWYTATAAHHPELRGRFDEAVRQMVAERQALVHGDFVPKNMLVLDDDRLMLLDYEIAHYGNPAYDVATFVNHLLLKSFAVPSAAEDLLAAADEFLAAYRAGAGPVEVAEDRVLLQLGCLMLARIDGKSPVEYITDDVTRDRVRSAGAAVLRGAFSRTDEVIGHRRHELASDVEAAV